MKWILFTVLIGIAPILGYTSVYAQKNQQDNKVNIHSVPPQPAVDMKTYLAENLKYPPKALNEGIGGAVVAEFYITEQGEIRNIKIVKKTVPEGYGFEEEVIRVLNNVKFKPAQDKEGKPKASYASQIITFRLDNKGRQTSPPDVPRPSQRPTKHWFEALQEG